MQVLKEAIRNKILQAAEEVFYAKDYRSARLIDIAKKAGVPVALIYTYFKNKEELFGEIVMTIYAKIIRNINEMEYVGEMGSDNFNRIGKLQMSELLLEQKIGYTDGQSGRNEICGQQSGHNQETAKNHKEKN